MLTCARSRRRVLSVLVRRVTGRETSFDSRKSTSLKGEGRKSNKNKNKRRVIRISKKKNLNP